MLALALGGFGIGTTEFVAMGLLPEMASGLGVSEPIAGHVISAYALGVVVGAPLIAALTARVPRRTLLIALMVAFTVGNAASVFAPSYTTLMMLDSSPDCRTVRTSESPHWSPLIWPNQVNARRPWRW